jgi:hypothetical protein
MKKLLLASSAIALMGLSGAASAQSVLERVLSSINVDNTNMLPVTGTFANIAENIAVLGNEVRYDDGDGSILTADEVAADYETFLTNQQNLADDAVHWVDPDDTGPLGAVWYSNAGTGGTTYATEAEAIAAARAEAVASSPSLDAYTTIFFSPVGGPAIILNNIDGSVTNVLTGVTDATASVGGTVLAIDQVKVDIGDVSTTVLGAVNTGTTSLGVNSDYNRAIAGTSSAVSGKVLQLGGIADQTALVLNVASNATSVVGSVSNTFTALNGSVGNIGTTVLGAVNTGTISSGVNAATNGIVSGIVGTTTP